MDNQLKQLIAVLVEKELKKQFANPPKLGDIKPTDQPDSERPGMENRPKDGMDVEQHHDMLNVSAKEEEKLQEAMSVVAGQMASTGTTDPAETYDFKWLDKNRDGKLDTYEMMWSQYVPEIVAAVLNKLNDKYLKESKEDLEEVSAVSGGGAGMQASGAVSATGGGIGFGPRKLTEEEFNEMSLALEAIMDEEIEEHYYPPKFFPPDGGDQPNTGGAGIGSGPRRAVTNEEDEEPIEEFNAIGTGAVVGYTGPLGMDPKAGHDLLWSGDEPIKKSKKKKKKVNESRYAWEAGKSVADVEGKTRYVIVYRAMPAKHDSLRTGDYLTPKKQFAVDHAVTSAIYHDEPFKVVLASVSTDEIVGADNPGEFRWSGGPKKVKAVSYIDADGNISRAPLDEEFIGTKHGAAYYQMGGSLPDKLYNVDKTGKATRDPGVGGLSKSKRKRSEKKDDTLEKELDKKEKKGKEWYQVD